MNLNDNNIDQVFRDAAQNSDAPRYDHSYWSEVSSILDSEDKRKRGFILWSVAGSIVFAFLISTLFIVNNNESNISLANNTNQSVGTIDQVQNDLENKTPFKDFTSSRVEKNTFNSQKITSNVNSKNSEIKRISKKETNVTASENSDHLKYTYFKERKSPVSTEDQSNEIAIKRSTKNKNQESEIKKFESNPDTPQINEVDMLLPLSIELEGIQVNNELTLLRLSKKKTLSFYAKISAGLMENYETSRPFESSLFDLSLNLEYIKEQVLFRTGLGVQATSNADLVVSERAKVYGFGITTHQNNLSYQSLYDIYIPIEIGYSLNNTSFGFGGQMNYMFGTLMNYERLENNVVASKSKLNGFKEGLNSFTAQGYIWMEQKLTDRFVAGIKVGTNLNSRIKEGRYFNESATTNPLYGQITLRYNFSK